MARFSTAAVRDFYDRQTTGFVTLGQGGGSGAIHRAVWAPGVVTRDQAFHHVEDVIASRIARGSGAPPLLALDLGCGIGGSLIHLASRHGVRGIGLTLSPVQASIATQRIATAGLTAMVTCREGDYTAIPTDVPSVDIAFAIESFVHGPSPARFFSEAFRALRPGGSLFVCDDVRGDAGGANAERCIEQFMRGWHINTLLDASSIDRLAVDAGFTPVDTIDLTAWLELGRPRDRALAAFVRAFGWLPLRRTRFAHIVGGTALQTCLRRGWIRYVLMHWRKPATLR
ncbi:MAG: methyltransferase domain-containing protein [Acidobacteria bacterium]|nr:methyltransferase domain-containing protein [Acidobacteriota bacterium]